MMAIVNKNQRYFLAIGYSYWDDREDHFWSDSLEEVWEKVCTNLSFDEFVQMMNKDGYVEDGSQMWYVIDTTKHNNF